ncbi:MAG TPA: FtsX-like permease family protein [Natronincola sp.]|nr:FtsX-like permease family protein [Natronincola sp.]
METLKFTLRIVKKRPLRSLLTVLQMGLGVWVVAIILSLNFQGLGALKHQDALKDSLARISIASFGEFEDGSMAAGTTNNLREIDAERLMESEYIEDAFIYEQSWGTNIIFDGMLYKLNSPAQASANYARAMGLEFVEGNFFTKQDQDQKNAVAVISETISKQLFPKESAIGKNITLQHADEYEIIGVYKDLPVSLFGHSGFTHMIMPLRTFYYGFDDSEEQVHDNIIIKSKPGKIYDAVEDAKVILADRSVDDMEVHGEYLKDSDQWMEEGIRSITIFLGVFAFIAIVISAIGILSIMLVSVVERTREIGLRQALGASKIKIVAQILNEALVFSLLGGLVGLIMAYFSAEKLIAFLLQEIADSQLGNLGGLHPKASVIAVGLSILIGQIFGLYPAIQGAKMPPVEALRDN